MRWGALASNVHGRLGLKSVVTLSTSAGPVTYDDARVRTKTRRGLEDGKFLKSAYVLVRIPALPGRTAPTEKDLLDWNGRTYTVDSVDTKSGLWVVEAK